MQFGLRRRQFITLLGGAAAWPVVARAQRGERARRIGMLVLEASIDLLPVGPVAANHWAPDFTSPDGECFPVSHWGFSNAKGFRALDGNEFALSSAQDYRDVEITLWARKFDLWLRATDDGYGIRFSVNEEVGGIGIVLHNELRLGPYESYYSGFWDPSFGAFDRLNMNNVPGFDPANAVGRSYTIGVSGFDVYVQMNGVDIWRGKQWLHLRPGKVRLKTHSPGGYGVHGRFVLSPLAAPSLHSDLANNILDPRDWGLKGVRTTGSITAGSNQLSVADASEITVGDKIIVELGGEVGAGRRGTVGVGGQWPALTYANEAKRNADKTRPDGTWCWVRSTGLTAQYYASDQQWHRSSWAPGDYYWSKALPKALRAMVTGTTGSTVTLNRTAIESTAGANIYIDNRDALMWIFRDYGPYDAKMIDNKVISLPAGQFAINGLLAAGGGRHRWEVKGQGKDATRLFSPRGAKCLEFSFPYAESWRVHDFELVGNAGDDGYGAGDWTPTGDLPEATPGNGMPNFAFTFGLNFGGNDNEVYACRVKDVWMKAIGGSYATRLKAHDCEVIQSVPWRRYIQWMIVTSDSLDCVFTNCSVTCPKLTAGFEGFRSDGIKFIKCVGTNAAMSMNSSGNFVIDDCMVTMKEGCEFLYITDYGETITPWAAHQNPIININSNIKPPSPAMQKGGLIRNATIIVEGPANARGDSFQALINVNWNNPNVRVIADPSWMARPCDAPLVGGYFRAPDGSSGAPNAPLSSGALAVRADGGADNLLIDGIRIDGYGEKTSWGRGNVQSSAKAGIVRNCVYRRHEPWGYDGIVVGGTTTKSGNVRFEQWQTKICVRNRP